MKLLVAVDLSESTETIVDKVESINKRDSAKAWILHTALPEPDRLEFKVDLIEPRENLEKNSTNSIARFSILQTDCANQVGFYDPSCAGHNGRNFLSRRLTRI